MVKDIIYSIKSPYRQSMDIVGYTFGSGERSCCVVGALRGNEIQQMAICAQLVDTLKRLEESGCVISGKSVMIIPCANNYSMNIGKRFWTMDNTDINRMFPGYDQGETTQRIADGLFKAIRDYVHGIQMASFYRDGDFLPHIKMMDTDYGKIETYESLSDFGLPYGLLRTPHPYDTTTLNYNWQVWGCRAYSLFSTYTDHIGKKSTQTAVNATLRFLIAKGILKWTLHRGMHTRILNEESIRTVKTGCAGMQKKHVTIGDEVAEGDILCEIVHPLEGNTISLITSPVDGTVFFAHNKQLVMEHTDMFSIVPFSNV
ncbi:MAG: succinylglutamate desuccinylase/aspartoacylase family protein [Chitinispirillales bacterium]|jgi:predicted deacylase|nr:succinylglutamate desuccinylase/aspartoacylase family protein [Chitinispirillales bacterium]